MRPAFPSEALKKTQRFLSDHQSDHRVDWISTMAKASQMRHQNCNQSRTKKVIGRTQGITKLTASVTRKKTIKKKKYLKEKINRCP